MISRQLLIDSLNEVKQQALSNKIYEPDFGICNNWSEIVDDNITYTLVGKLSKGWKHHTGWCDYLVPDDEDYGLWEGVNLEMRLSLIDYLLNELENLTQEQMNELGIRDVGRF